MLYLSAVFVIAFLTILTFYSLKEKDDKLIISVSDKDKEEMKKYLAFTKEQIDIQNKYYNELVEEEFDSVLTEVDTLDTMAQYRSREGTIKYILLALEMDDLDMFMEAFSINNFSKDLHANPETNKDKVIKRYMNLFSKNGSLQNIRLIEKQNGVFNHNYQYYLHMDYGTDQLYKIPIEFDKLSHYHNQEKKSDIDEVYTIRTSIVKILSYLK